MAGQKGRSGRPKAPTKTKELRGKERKDRRNDEEPIPAVGEIVAPDDLTPEAKAVWLRLTPDLIAKKVLTLWDVDAFAVFCDAIARGDEARKGLNENGTLVQAPVFNKNGDITGHRTQVSQWWRVWKDANAVALQYGARFGWTPSDRAGLKIGTGFSQPKGSDLLTG